MKTFMMKLALLMTTSLVFAHTAQAFDHQHYIQHAKPYLGAQAEWRHMPFEDAFGGNVFSENLTQVDIYTGVRLFEYIGLQGGYEFTEKKSRQNTINELETYLGQLIQVGGGSQNHSSETKITGWHLEVVGFLPICKRYNVDLLASLGFVRHHLELEDSMTAVNGVPLANQTYRSYDVKKTLARASIGVQMLFFDFLGLKLSGTWEDTSRFNLLKPQGFNNANTTVIVKDSLIYGAGLFVTMP